MTEDFSPYTEQFYRDHLDLEHKTAMDAIARELVARYHPEYVLDWGAGVGNLIESFRSHGVRAEGYEPYAVFHVLSPILRDSLLAAYHWKDWSPSRKFDLVTCLEVAEHVPSEEAPALIASLTGKSDRIFFSSAIPGQGGTGHIHETENYVWDDLFLNEGFVRNPEASRDVVRGYANEVGTLWWYRNARVYERSP